MTIYKKQTSLLGIFLPLFCIGLFGCTENNRRDEYSSVFKILPLSPYKWSKESNCAKFFLLELTNGDSMELIKKLTFFLDTSREERKLVSNCNQTHFIFYKKSSELDTSFRETKQTSLAAHQQDLITMIEYVNGFRRTLEFYSKGKTVFFNYDSSGKVKTVTEFKR